MAHAAPYIRKPARHEGNANAGRLRVARPANMEMSLRYAHLAPAFTRAAGLTFVPVVVEVRLLKTNLNRHGSMAAP
jgi:hypothetical protein